MNEILGRSRFAPTVFGCQAPDTGNAEILAQYGTPEQKKRYLEPLLDNEIVSCFSMTEPQGGADPKVFTTRAELKGDNWVINGEKWFSSNAHWSSFLIAMAVTDPDAPPYQRMSIFIVPTDTPGVNIVRNVGVGQEAEAARHAYIRYQDVHVPEGPSARDRAAAASSSRRRASAAAGFTTRCAPIGQVRKAFDLMCERALSRTTQGSLLADKQMVQEKIADSWIEIEQFRLLVLRTAWRIDKYKDYLKVRKDIAAVKAAMPKVFHDVVARALQLHGSLGVTREMPFVEQVMESFVMGLADGPTEVHKITLGAPGAARLQGHHGPVPDRPHPRAARGGDPEIRRSHRARGGRAMTTRRRAIRFQRQGGGDHRRQPRHRPRDGARVRGRRRQARDREPQARHLRGDRQGNSRARRRRARRTLCTSANGTIATASPTRFTRAGGAPTCSSTTPASRRWRRRRLETSEELFDKIIGVNLKGPFRLSALFGSRMVAANDGGAIINISSTAAIRPRSGNRAVRRRQGWPEHPYSGVCEGVRSQGPRQLHHVRPLPHRHQQGMVSHRRFRQAREGDFPSAACRRGRGGRGRGALLRKSGCQLHHWRDPDDRRRLGAPDHADHVRIVSKAV